MSAQQIWMLQVYAALVALSVALALARRWLRPGAGGPSVWRKYPTYLLLNLAVLASAWLPRAWHTLALALALVGAGAAWELARALHLSRAERAGLPIAVAALVLAAEWLAPPGLLALWAAGLLAAAAGSALLSPAEQLGARVAALAGALLYLPLGLLPLIWVWHSPQGELKVALLYLIIAGNDGFAQIVGQLVGGRRLAPRLSPGKTVAGALGGLACAAAMGALLGPTIGWAALPGAGLGALIGAAGQVGDLVESSWKRALGVKDFSALLGPQGGVLDRFDALLLAAPIFAALAGPLWR